MGRDRGTRYQIAQNVYNQDNSPIVTNDRGEGQTKKYIYKKKTDEISAPHQCIHEVCTWTPRSGVCVCGGGLRIALFAAALRLVCTYAKFDAVSERDTRLVHHVNCPGLPPVLQHVFLPKPQRNSSNSRAARRKKASTDLKKKKWFGYGTKNRGAASISVLKEWLEAYKTRTRRKSQNLISKIST